MRIPFLIGSYKGRSGAINVSECVNFFAEPDELGGKNVLAFIGTPGLKKWCDTGTGQSIRGMHRFGDYLYVVSDHKLLKIDKDATVTEIGDIQTNVGFAHLENNGTQLMVIDAVTGYVYNPSTDEFKQIKNTAFSNATTLTYQDGYFIANIPETRQFQISNLYDGLSWSGLDYAAKEGYPDLVESLISVHRYLFLLGEKTSEIWVNTGTGAFPFERIDGASMDVGCAAPHSPAKLDNTIYWLSDKRQIVRVTGAGTHQIVSTPQIDYQIANYTKVDDAIGYAMTFEGHPWFRITFPAANKTWCYDAMTGLWHTLSSWDETKAAQHGRHRGSCYARFNGKHLIGDHDNGLIYETRSDYYTDYDRPIESIGVGRIAHKDGKELAFNEFTLEMEPGVGNEYDYLVDEAGRYIFGSDGTYMSGASQEAPDPKITIDWTDDGGNTWSKTRIISLHERGVFRRVVPARATGSSRNRAFRVRISDPVKRVIVAAYAEVTVSS